MDKGISGKELITVAVAVYNAKDYLAKAVDSIIEQDYQHLDCINFVKGHSFSPCFWASAFRVSPPCQSSKDFAEQRSYKRYSEEVQIRSLPRN